MDILHVILFQLQIVYYKLSSKYHPVFLKIGLVRPRHTTTAAAMLYLICSNEENKLEFTPDSSHPLVVYTLLLAPLLLPCSLKISLKDT